MSRYWEHIQQKPTAHFIVFYCLNFYCLNIVWILAGIFSVLYFHFYCLNSSWGLWNNSGFLTWDWKLACKHIFFTRASYQFSPLVKIRTNSCVYWLDVGAATENISWIAALLNCVLAAAISSFCFQVRGSVLCSQCQALLHMKKSTISHPFLSEGKCSESSFFFHWGCSVLRTTLQK